MGSWESCAAGDGTCGPLLSRGAAPQLRPAGAPLLPHRARTPRAWWWLALPGCPECSPGLWVHGWARPIKSHQWSDIMLQELPEEGKGLSAQGWSLLQNGCPQESGRGQAGPRCPGPGHCPRGGEIPLSGPCACPKSSQEPWPRGVGCMAVPRQEGGLPFPGAYPRVSVSVVSL